MRDLDDEKRIKEYMAAKMKHIKMYHECMNLADGLDVAKFAELVRADEREKCAKREWVGLSRDEVDYCFEQCVVRKFSQDGVEDSYVSIYKAAEAIETALKEKNT